MSVGGIGQPTSQPRVQFESPGAALDRANQRRGLPVQEFGGFVDDKFVGPPAPESSASSAGSWLNSTMASVSAMFGSSLDTLGKAFGKWETGRIGDAVKTGLATVAKNWFGGGAAGGGMNTGMIQAAANFFVGLFK